MCASFSCLNKRLVDWEYFSWLTGHPFLESNNTRNLERLFRNRSLSLSLLINITCSSRMIFPFILLPSSHFLFTKLITQRINFIFPFLSVSKLVVNISWRFSPPFGWLKDAHPDVLVYFSYVASTLLCVAWWRSSFISSFHQKMMIMGIDSHHFLH